MDHATSSTSLPFSSRAVRMHGVKAYLRDLKQFAIKHRQLLSVLAILLFVFYWFEIRPIHVNSICSTQASANSRSLLATKAQIATDAAQRASYQQMLQQNLYLRSDYESFYNKCMRGYGFFGN